MTTTRKHYSPRFKARVAVKAIRGEKTLNQLASQLQVHPNGDVEKDALYEEIGRLKVELDWLKKKWACSSEERRRLVEPEHGEISVRRQCELLGVSRSSLYYQPAGGERREPGADAPAG